MSNGDEQVDWSRVHHLRGTGMSAADALAQVRAEYVEQGVPRDTPDAASDAESKLSDAEHKAFHSKSCSPSESVRWVACRLGTKPKLSDAPSAGTWNLFVWASASAMNRADFVRSLWSKLLPTQSELVNEARFSDDGHEIIEMIEGLLAKHKEDAAEAERQRLLRMKAAQMNGSVS